MLNSITISNFESYKYAKLILSSGVNAITGPSDSGKTAIIRLIRWVAKNEPLGTAFRSWWGGDTSGIFEIDENLIERVRTDSENKYILNGTDFLFDKTTWMDVPEEIRSLLNMNDLNLQKQFDRPFLLDSSPGEVAAHFNSIAHLDAIGVGTKTVNKWITKIEQAIASGEKQLEENQINLQKYDYLDDLDKQVTELEALEKQQNRLAEQYTKMVQWKNNYISIQKRIMEYQSILKIEDLVNETLQLNKEWVEYSNEVNDIKELVQQSKSINEQITKYNKMIKLESIINATIELTKQKQELRTNKDIFGSLLDRIKKTNVMIYKSESDLIKMEKEFKTKFPDTCPFFGVVCEHIKKQKEKNVTIM